MAHASTRTLLFSLLLIAPIFAGCTFLEGASKSVSLDCIALTNKAKSYAERDPRGDDDGDGLTNEEELWWVTDPTVRDTNSDGVSDGDSIKGASPTYPFVDISCVDFDHDGIPAGAETFYTFTNPNERSTDGDRWTDGQEFFGGTWKAYLNTGPSSSQGDCISEAQSMTVPPYVKRDPLQPAVPEIAVSTSGWELLYDVTYQEGVETKTENEKITTARTENAFSQKTDAFARGSLTVGLKAEVKNKVSSNIFAEDTGVSKSVELSAELKVEAGGGRAWEWADSRTRFEEDTTKGSRTSTSQETVNYDKTKVVANVFIENIGNDILRCPLDGLTIGFALESAYLTGGVSIGTWPPIDKPLANVPKNLQPGQKMLVGVAEVSLDVPSFKMIRDGMPVVVTIEGHSFGADQLYLAAARNSSATFNIDYGNGTLARRYVAVPTEGRPLVEAYNTFGSMTVGDVNGISIIKSIDGRDTSTRTVPYRIWSVQLITADDREEPLDLSKVRVQRGDTIMLRYIRDSDGDLIADSDEYLYGMDPNRRDTDRDGLDDGDEMYGIYHEGNDITYFPDPRYPDSDFDGVSDADEIAAGTDPATAIGTASADIVRLTSQGLCQVLYGSDEGYTAAPDPFQCHTPDANRVAWGIGDVYGDGKAEIVVGDPVSGACIAYDARLRGSVARIPCSFAAGRALAVGRLTPRDANSPFASVVTTTALGKCDVWQMVEGFWKRVHTLPCGYTAEDTGIYVGNNEIIIAKPEGACVFVKLNGSVSARADCNHEGWGSLAAGSFAHGYPLATRSAKGCALVSNSVTATFDCPSGGFVQMVAGDLERGGGAELLTSTPEGTCKITLLVPTDNARVNTRLSTTLPSCVGTGDQLAVGDVW